MLTGHTSTVSYIQTSRDHSHGMTIASGSYDHTIRLYDGETGAWLSSYDTSSMVNCFFMDSQRVIAPSRHGPYQLASLSVWDVRSNRPAVNLSNGESGEIFSMGVCGDVVVTGSTSAVQVITSNPFGTRRNDWNAVNVTLRASTFQPVGRQWVSPRESTTQIALSQTFLRIILIIIAVMGFACCWVWLLYADADGKEGAGQLCALRRYEDRRRRG